MRIPVPEDVHLRTHPSPQTPQYTHCSSSLHTHRTITLRCEHHAAAPYLPQEKSTATLKRAPPQRRLHIIMLKCAVIKKQRLYACIQETEDGSGVCTHGRMRAVCWPSPSPTPTTGTVSQTLTWVCLCFVTTNRREEAQFVGQSKRCRAERSRERLGVRLCVV